MDRLLDGAVGTPNLHRLRETLKALNKTEDFVVFNSEACHCPSTGYAGGGLDIFWDRAERYAHTILADLAAGSQGWLEWNLILDAIGGPNHVGNLCETTMLAVPHRATDPAAHTLSSLPDFEYHKPIGTNSIKGDNRTREELNALGIQAKFLDLGIAVQPLYYYMGHISRHVRPGSVAAPALVRQNLGEGEIFMPLGAAVVGGGENDLARNGIELTLWPCEGSTRQQFRWNHDSLKRISVWGHDWLGNQVVSCVGRDVDKDLLGMTLTDCNTKSAGVFDVIPIPNDEHGRFNVRLMNHPKKKSKHCLTILPLGNNGGANGPLGGPQVALGNCNEASAKWKLDLVLGRASTIFYADDKGDNELCLTTGWPFLQMGAFRTPTGSAPKTVVILNEAKDAANYALKDDDNVLITGSIPRGLFKQYF
jgi:glucosylceramidase